MKILLTENEQVVLKEILSKDPNGQVSFDGCFVILDEDSADDLRNQCGDYLLEVGFDKNYTPTDKGRALEALIDKLFV